MFAILPAKIVQRQDLQTRVHVPRARDRYPDRKKVRQHFFVIFNLGFPIQTLCGIARNCAEMSGICGIKGLTIAPK